MKTYLLALVALLSFAAPALADDFCPNCRKPSQVRQQAQARAGQPEDALDVLNRQRAARGLRPYLRDPLLTIGAKSVAAYRAARGIHGHSSNDFGFLPDGALAPVAGCAAWERGTGFGACEAYGRWRYCGAAWCVGRDGLVYCHAFYRN